MSRFGGYVSFDEYFEKEGKVYVKNKTNPLGYVSINVGDNNNPKYFTLIKTVVPICLTDFFIKEDLRKSVDLRQLVMKGAVELVSEEDYKKAVTPELASKVLDAMMSYDSKSTMSDVNRIKDAEEVKSVVVQLVRMNTLSDEERVEAGNDVLSDDAIIAELEALDLSEVDKSYIFTNSKGKVKQWITKLLSVEGGVDLGGDIVVDVSNQYEPVDDVEKVIKEVENVYRKRGRRK